MRLIPPLLAIALLPACATTTGERSPMAQNGAEHCSAEALQFYVGQKATAAVGAELLTKSGARTLRWGPPRSAWTMDLRQDRLNVAYDDALTISSVNCG